VKVQAEFAFEDLPGFAPPSVPGQAGRVIVGTLDGASVVAFAGRVHLYEGQGMDAVTRPVRLAHALGAHTVAISSAVGSLDANVGPGALVVLHDHLNLMGESPLVGWRKDDGTPPFVGMAAAYDPVLAASALERAEELGLKVALGVYAAVAGPNYETPAEISFLRDTGASVVGMSMVPEVVAARALGLRVLGLCAVANATGVHVEHAAVVREVEAISGGLGRVVTELAAELATPPVGPLA